MAKKQIISDALQKKFNKPQFQIGDAVFFSWLGQKQYGHVKQLKQNSWGIQYTVESSSKVKYPCGIQIQGQKTAYNVGYIFLEDTISIGTEELERRIQTTINTRRITTVSINTTGSTNQSRDNTSSSRSDDGEASTKNKKSRTVRSSKSNAVSSSSNRINKNNKSKRTVSESTQLDQAIAKQRSFLDFTKPIKKD